MVLSISARRFDLRLRGASPLFRKQTFASRTSRNCGKYSRNAHEPDLPGMEHLGLVRTAYFPRPLAATRIEFLLYLAKLRRNG